MFEITIPTLAPIFLTIALGWGLSARRMLPDGFFQGLNTLAFYIGLPALLLLAIATSPLAAGPALRMFGALLAATASVTLAAYPLARLLKLGPPGTASFVQASMRGNLAYIGLPLVFFALEDASPAAADTAALRAAALLALASTVPLYNLACIVILTHGARAAGARMSLSSLARKVASNPLLIACLLGIALSLGGIRLPSLAVRTLQPLGQMALPLALLSIGASFTRGGSRRSPWTALVASLLKVGAAPAVGLLFCSWFGLAPRETLITLLFLACPTAVTSYVMAEKMGGDADLAGDAVVASTLLSLIPLAAILMACGG